MSDKHPYANVNGALIRLLDQLRKSFPAIVDADLMKKLGLAPKNESYVINVIRFLGLINDEGKGTDEAHKVFSLHEDQAFHQEFAGIVTKAYGGLFEIYKDDTWAQSEDKLVSFFRQTDQSSDIVGSRQASTFKSLAIYAGRSSQSVTNPKPKSAKKSPGPNTKPQKVAVKHNGLGGPQNGSTAQPKHGADDHRVSLTVRIEVNLPAGGDQDTYDRIFRSIRENLMNG